MHNITPHLWFDTQAVEAAEFYSSVLPDSKVTHVSQLYDTPSGDTDIVSFELSGQPFMAISAGPLFKFNPSVSFMVWCADAGEVNKLWTDLSEGGTALMPLDSYPFSDRYGWTSDRYGLNWQIMQSPGPMPSQRITPTLMFTGAVTGKAEDAINFYTSVFPDSSVGDFMRYSKGEEPDQEGTVKYGPFVLDGRRFAAMDSAQGHDFSFNEAISFIINCDSQTDIDRFWGALSAVPESEQCGWLKDKFGLSWQVVPSAMSEMMSQGSSEQMSRVTEAFLKMKKLDIAELENAYGPTH